MDTYSGPLTVDWLEPLIAQAVEEFAKEPSINLKSTLWYHGEPWWFIRREEPDAQFFREVHIAVFSTTGNGAGAREKKYLFFMPQGYRYRENIREATPSATADMVQCPLEDFPRSEEMTRGKIKDLLAQAWERAKNFTEDNLIRPQ